MCSDVHHSIPSRYRQVAAAGVLLLYIDLFMYLVVNSMFFFIKEEVVLEHTFHSENSLHIRWSSCLTLVVSTAVGSVLQSIARSSVSEYPGSPFILFLRGEECNVHVILKYTEVYSV